MPGVCVRKGVWEWKASDLSEESEQQSAAAAEPKRGIAPPERVAGEPLELRRKKRNKGR